jgi:hypothetical protein
MCWPSKSEWRGATILERRTRTGIVSCSTSHTFFIASRRWHRWASGCHSSSPGVLSGMGFSRCCGEQMPSARNARPKRRPRGRTRRSALHRRHQSMRRNGSSGRFRSPSYQGVTCIRGEAVLFESHQADRAASPVPRHPAAQPEA